MGEEEEEDADGTTEEHHLVLPLSILFLPDLHQFNKLFFVHFLIFLRDFVSQISSCKGFIWANDIES